MCFIIIDFLSQFNLNRITWYAFKVFFKIKLDNFVLYKIHQISRQILTRAPIILDIIIELPFFIQWLTDNHPSKDGNGVAKISKLVIADDEKLADSWFQDEIESALTGVEIEWVKPELNEGDKGIVAVELTVNNSKIRLD